MPGYLIHLAVANEYIKKHEEEKESITNEELKSLKAEMESPGFYDDLENSTSISIKCSAIEKKLNYNKNFTVFLSSIIIDVFAKEIEKHKN